LAAWFLRGFPMVKVESKALFYKELDGGFVRLSLRWKHIHIVSFTLKPLLFNGFFVLYGFYLFPQIP
jgi:hypothetical protein